MLLDEIRKYLQGDTVRSYLAIANIDLEYIVAMVASLNKRHIVIEHGRLAISFRIIEKMLCYGLWDVNVKNI